MKYILYIIVFILPFSLSGQITSCPEIANTKDSDLKEVRDFWISYINDTKSVDILPSNKYWDKNEIDDGYGDIVLKSIQIPYLFGNLKILNIEKVGNSLYRIHNEWSFRDSLLKYKFFIYAKKGTEDYKLINAFSIIRPTLQHFKYDNFDFYCPNDHPFESSKALKSIEFYRMITKLYGINEKDKITYITGANLDIDYKLLGIEESMYNSRAPLEGFTINTKNFIILSDREYHAHELIHAVFIPELPHSQILFGEGIATFYGGNVNRNLIDVIKELKALVKDKPDIDLSNFENIDKILNDGKFNNFYFIGAIFIDYALKLGGPNKVLALLKFPVNDPYTFEDARKAIEKELGIKKSQLDSFLKEYIQNFKTG